MTLSTTEVIAPCNSVPSLTPGDEVLREVALRACLYKKQPKRKNPPKFGTIKSPSFFCIV
jgi:hypothetical protein